MSIITLPLQLLGPGEPSKILAEMGTVGAVAVPVVAVVAAPAAGLIVTFPVVGWAGTPPETPSAASTVVSSPGVTSSIPHIAQAAGPR